MNLLFCLGFIICISIKKFKLCYKKIIMQKVQLELNTLAMS